MQPVRLGNHELLVRLASGGAANVFLVRDLSSSKQDRLLALKILLPALASNEDFLNMFFTEARIASRLKHENVVAITGFGQVEGIHCLAMEYVFGASLAQVLRASARAKKPLTVGVLLRITAAVCDALHFAHEMGDDHGQSMGLVHRDVTPQNILIGFNGVPKITDFGIAKATGRGWETQAGIVKGKFSYMSPEQALGKKVDRRSDIFGTGIVLWESLTGRDLFKGSTPMEVLAAIREQKIEPPSRVVPGLTPIVDPIVMKALRRSPRQRYQTSAEMRDDILDLIRRAGVEIDADTIAKEFYAIYGDEIADRAMQLRKAMAGKADVENLARVLGGHPLNPKHLPVIPGGETHPDPLGLFTEEQSSFNGELSPQAEREATSTRTDFEIVNVVVENEPRAWKPEAPPEEGVTEWNPGHVGDPGEDELLSMLSEEDATVGLVPKEFADRFGAQLQAVRAGREPLRRFDDEEKTEGRPNSADMANIRALHVGDEASLGPWQHNRGPYGRQPSPEPGRSLSYPDPDHRSGPVGVTPGPGHPPSSRSPVPRAPSLALDSDPEDATRPFPRAPSLFIEELEYTPSATPAFPSPREHPSRSGDLEPFRDGSASQSATQSRSSPDGVRSPGADRSPLPRGLDAPPTRSSNETESEPPEAPSLSMEPGGSLAVDGGILEVPRPGFSTQESMISPPEGVRSSPGTVTPARTFSSPTTSSPELAAAARPASGVQMSWPGLIFLMMGLVVFGFAAGYLAALG